VVRNVTLVKVMINETEYFRKTISATGQLNVNVLYLGGLPDHVRVARQAEGSVVRAEITEAPRNFKGIIQDVQVSDGSGKFFVEFFPLIAEDLKISPAFGEVSFDHNLVLEGVVSDDSCKSNPCQHNGSCYITWNDFRCECTRGYKGKMCQEMEFCQLQQCPRGGTCRNLDNGYECVANATFDGHNMSLSYALTLPDKNYDVKDLPLDSINITYRSRTGGTLLCISSSESGEYFLVSVQQDEVMVSWKFVTMSEGVSKRFHKEYPDGNWTTIFIRLHDDGISGQFSSAGEDPPQAFTASKFPHESWHRLVTNSKILLGGKADIPENVGFGDEFSVSNRHSYVTFDSMTSDVTGPGISENAVDYPSSVTATPVAPLLNNGGFFKGCLGEVRIGGLLLPFFTPDQLNSTQDIFHLSVPSDRVLDLDGNCRLCFENECQNGGWCKDPSDSYVCNCSAGFEGDYCSSDINECQHNECYNNATCIDGIANYTCQCQQGWEGWLCETDVDECASNPCQNNGTCLNLLGRFECNCTHEYMGTFCESKRIITCDNAPCMKGSTCEDTKNKETGDNYTCICREGYKGTNCDKPYCLLQGEECQNKGLCDVSNNIPICQCPTGYEGPNCTTDIDECSIGNTQCGAGTCINIPGRFKCQCPVGKCGPQCATDDPCYENPCKNAGRCFEKCVVLPVDYTCECPAPYMGKNCTEMYVEEASSNAMDIALIVAPIIGLILIIASIGLIVFITMARKKRATRGTYSPSQQEYCNPRVEMDNVMKPPPEERLI
ncbi:hypothetical protein L9F63_021779, partial [Diploptera punctata]